MYPDLAGKYSIYVPQRDGSGLTFVLVIHEYLDGLPVRRQSPIQVVTTWQTHDLSIASSTLRYTTKPRNKLTVRAEVDVVLPCTAPAPGRRGIACRWSQ